MNNLAEKSLQLWHEQQAYLRGINNETPQHEYEQALTVCADIHTHLGEVADKEEYISFLTLYADLFATKGNLSKEIEIQEEIVSVREQQANANGVAYKKKLSNSLLYAAMLNSRAVNVHKAIEYMEKHHACEQNVETENPGTNRLNVVLSTFRLANMYAHHGRNILAEDYYTESIVLADELRNSEKEKEEEYSLLLGELLIELGNFYLNSRMVSESIDRYIQSVDTLFPYRESNESAAVQIQSLYRQLETIYTATGDIKRAEHYRNLNEHL